MCRMVGVVAERPVSLRALLHEAPRNLASLSTEHPDGWGVARLADDGWRIDRDVDCAARSARWREVVSTAEARLAIAHVRRRTIGPIGELNTHPFRRGRFVLAHNGTIHDVRPLEAATRREHRDAVRGDTDSERLFAFLLSQMEAAGDTQAGLAVAVRALRRMPTRDSATFLLSDGERLFAYRQGRSLYALARDRGTRSASVAVASEPLTDEHWLEVPEGTLVVAEASARPRVLPLVAAA